MTPKRITNDRIAHEIALELFKLSNGETAERLVLERDDKDFGGWGFGPAKDAIYRVMARQLKKRQRQRPVPKSREMDYPRKRK